MTMINMYIIFLWKEHLKEAEDGMGDGVRFWGDRWVLTLYFLSVV